MTDAGPPTNRGEDGEEARRVLEAKYDDYCSAQLADLLLYLSPDEIFVLAQKAVGASDEPGASSYAGMVALATRWLQERVVLPPFDVWLEDYRRHPEDYDAWLMGLWESEFRVRSEG